LFEKGLRDPEKPLCATVIVDLTRIAVPQPAVNRRVLQEALHEHNLRIGSPRGPSQAHRP
jgi:hypothetical protein